MQAMDELKILLDENDVQYTEKELVIVQSVSDGYPNQTIENLSEDFFVRNLCDY